MQNIALCFICKQDIYGAQKANKQSLNSLPRHKQSSHFVCCISYAYIMQYITFRVNLKVKKQCKIFVLKGSDI